ncbi:PH domain-containing protein [Methanofollis ethanolicus]|uniref:PH domain-containing protein n=1 Tax=Methanofollis ethanolicus TaxID=488124 RepID=UPI00082F0A37|nr:PH domain-containing protein [Methanofollis ethanolicus]
MPISGPFRGHPAVDEEEPVHETGAGGEVYRRLNRKCMVSMYIGHAISYAVLLAGYLLLTTFSQEFLGSYYGLVQYAALAVLAIALVYSAAAPPVYYARYRYQITEDRVDVRCGVLVIRHILVPIERVHQVEVSRGPINTMLGLADVTITTAGGDATIEYLEIEEAEKVADLLNKLIGRMLLDRIKTAPAATATAGPADE